MPMRKVSAVVGTLVTVKADESLTSQVTGILDRNGTIDLDERSESLARGRLVRCFD